VCLALLVLLATTASASAENPTTAPVETTPHSTTTVSPTTHFRHESFKEFEKQLHAGEVAAATFNERARTLHLSLKDGGHTLVGYSSHDEPRLAAELRANGASTQIEEKTQKTGTKAKATHHTLRYIAGGIAVVLVGMLVAALFVKRRRQYQGAPAPSGDAG
jgi:ATP-dependent Zn protease